MRWVIMVLFGNEFDFDEGAEVCGGLRGGEGDNDASRVAGHVLSVHLGEDGLGELGAVGDVSADHRNAV